MFSNIVLEMFWWQFFEVPRFILKGWINFLRFGFNYFSIFHLLKTLFYPWRKYQWFHGRGFDFWLYLEALLSNLIFRFLGFLMRTFLIIIGIFFEVIIFFTGLFIFLIWFFLPLILFFGFYKGFELLSLV